MFSRLLKGVFCLLCCASLSSFADYKVIASSNVDIDVLTKKKMRSFYLRKQSTFASGDKAEIVGLSESNARSAFLKDVVRKSEANINSYWSRLMFSGRASAPMLFENDAAVINYAAQKSRMEPRISE